MPDEVPVLRRHHDDAVVRLGNWLSDAGGGARISDLALHEAFPSRRFAAGWRLPIEFPEGVRQLHVAVDAQFPFSTVRIGLADPPPLLTWPHLEEEGLLCLPHRPTLHDPIEDTKPLLGDACDLITRNSAGIVRSDFQDEFLSYWARDPGLKGVEFTSLLRSASPSRQIAVWRGAEWFIVAETEEQLHSWSRNRFGSESSKVSTESAALLWIPEPLLPEQYPRTAADVWILARETDGGRKLLQELSIRCPKRIVTVLGADSKHGPCFAGVTVESPVEGRPGKMRSSLQKGFRPGHVPPSVASNRYWMAATPVVRSKVARADAGWVHGRGRDARQETLSKATAVVLGAGSVGAPVAEQLAMAGVGRLIIIDPERLTAANTGRHPLGAKHVRKYKAEALALELRENYPHHQFEFRNDGWQTVNASEPELLKQTSLVLSVMGDWNAEDALNTWHLNGRSTPPVVYGWTEEHACAGHAVAITPTSAACLKCGLSEVGDTLFRVTRWLEPTLRQEPGCGSLYQPYGPVEVAHTVSLITELALDVLLGVETGTPHRIWACRRAFLESCGGEWTHEWLDFCDQRSEGAFCLQREWPKNGGCRSCAGHN